MNNSSKMYADYNNKDEFNEIIRYLTKTRSVKLPNGHYISKYGKKMLFEEGHCYLVLEQKKNDYYINNYNDETIKAIDLNEYEKYDLEKDKKIYEIFNNR